MTPSPGHASVSALLTPDLDGLTPALAASLTKTLEQLTEDQREAVLAAALQQTAQEQAALPPVEWRTGVEPVPFTHLGLDLFPLQGAIFEEAGINRACDILSPHRAIQLLVIVYGKGAGKDLIIAAFIAYLSYVILQLRRPWKVLEVHPATKLAIVNVAPSEFLARHRNGPMGGRGAPDVPRRVRALGGHRAQCAQQ